MKLYFKMPNKAERQEERDRMKSLSVEIDNLYYSTIEQQICSFFDMGETNTNTKKTECAEDCYGRCTIHGSKKMGKFSIHIIKLKNGKYRLVANCCDLYCVC